MSMIRAILIKLMGWLYRRVKSSPLLSAVYYSAANTNYFSDLQIQEGMLADTQRVDTYHQAIVKHIQPGDTVLDLGAGTGILGFMTMEKNPRKLYSIEHGPVIELAKKASADNGFRNVEFVNLNSRNFKTTDKIDVLLHEQMGAFCFDERMVENILDLRDRVMKPGGKILPGIFRWFIEPVKLMDHKAIPFVWEKDLHGISFRALKDHSDSLGTPYRIMRATHEGVDYLLSRPSHVIHADLHTMQHGDLPKRMEITRRIERAGRLDGFCTFFETYFDDEISFSTEPHKSTLHWTIPVFRVPAQDLKVGDEVNFILEMEDFADPKSYRYTWNVRS